MAGFRELRNTLRRIYAEFSEKNVTFMAAGIAYNAFISLAPLLLVLLLVVSAFGGGLEERLVALSYRSLPAPIADVVARVFEGDSATSGASAVGLLVLMWGTLKIFRGLDTAFSEIYETVGENSFVDEVVDGLVVLVAMVVAVLATVGVTAVFARLEDVIPFVGLVTPLVLVVGLIFAFFPIYYCFPDVDVDRGHVLPGVVFAALGWSAFQGLFQVYLDLTGGGPESFFGGVIVVVTWLYFSGLVLLLGAVINSVLAGHASGEAGGVGQGASDYETDREESMNRDEFAEYLAALREHLTGHFEEMGPTADEWDSDRFAPPDGDVAVIEQSSPDDDGTRWEVAFRWRSAEGGSNAGASGGDD
jgi:membrane protein